MLNNLNRISLIHFIRTSTFNYYKIVLCNYATTTNTSRTAETMLIESSLEQPVIAVTDKENADMIGPPDPVSNLRPVIRKHLTHETYLQERLRLLQDETQEWNQKFWTEHNTNFLMEKKKFLREKKVLGTDIVLSPDEMSEFYKKFLDENWRKHVRYNLDWYKRNFRILILALRASLPDTLQM